MLAVDKDLRDSAAAIRAIDHLLPPPRFLIEVNLGVGDALSLQQRARHRAIRAPPCRIHLNPSHLPSRSKRYKFQRDCFVALLLAMTIDLLSLRAKRSNLGKS